MSYGSDKEGIPIKHSRKQAIICNINKHWSQDHKDLPTEIKIKITNMFKEIKMEPKRKMSKRL